MVQETCDRIFIMFQRIESEEDGVVKETQFCLQSEAAALYIYFVQKSWQTRTPFRDDVGKQVR